jgi:hypothetical protein
MKTYQQSEGSLRKVGCANATGDTLRAMLARLLSDTHGGKPEKYFSFLASAKTDSALYSLARPMLSNRALAWDALLA